MTTSETTRPIADDGRVTWTVGHDGSAGASTAVDWVLQHAAGRDVRLVLVRSWEIPALDFPFPADPIADYAPPTVCTDIADVEAAAKRAGVELTTRVERGFAANVLLDTSAEGDLLVVGSRGMGGFRRLLLGSISSQCATHATVPTIVVPATAVTDRAMGRIVVGVDGSERSLRALDWATEFAPEECEVAVVGTWMPSRSGYVAVAQHYTDERQQAEKRFEEILDEREAEAGEKLYTRRFVFAEAAKTLLEEAEHADLVVLGQRGHSGLSGAILGSVTTHVLHHSPAPVAVVPDGE